MMALTQWKKTRRGSLWQFPFYNIFFLFVEKKWNGSINEIINRFQHVRAATRDWGGRLLPTGGGGGGGDKERVGWWEGKGKGRRWRRRGSWRPLPHFREVSNSSSPHLIGLWGGGCCCCHLLCGSTNGHGSPWWKPVVMVNRDPGVLIFNKTMDWRARHWNASVSAGAVTASGGNETKTETRHAK